MHDVKIISKCKACTVWWVHAALSSSIFSSHHAWLEMHSVWYTSCMIAYVWCIEKATNICSSQWQLTQAAKHVCICSPCLRLDIARTTHTASSPLPPGKICRWCLSCCSALPHASASPLFRAALGPIHPCCHLHLAACSNEAKNKFDSLLYSNNEARWFRVSDVCLHELKWTHRGFLQCRVAQKPAGENCQVQPAQDSWAHWLQAKVLRQQQQLSTAHVVTQYMNCQAKAQA